GAKASGFTSIGVPKRPRPPCFLPMALPAFPHARDGYRLHYSADDARTTGPCNAARRPDVGRYTFKRHDRNGSRRFRDFGLFRIDDVHDYAALLHFRHSSFDPFSSCLLHTYNSLSYCDYTKIVYNEI